MPLGPARLAGPTRSDSCARSPKMARELMAEKRFHFLAQLQKGSDKSPGDGREPATLRVLAADLCFDQQPAGRRLAFFDGVPHIAITVHQVRSSLLDRARAFDGLEHLADAETESVTAFGFQPDFDARLQRRRLRGALRTSARHGVSSWDEPAF